MCEDAPVVGILRESAEVVGPSLSHVTDMVWIDDMAGCLGLRNIPTHALHMTTSSQGSRILVG